MKSYKRFAEVYDAFMYDQPYDQWMDITEQLIAPGYEVLELACGTGTIAGMLEDIPSIRVTGIDLSENMIDIARSKFPDITFHTMDMTNFSLNKQYDLITCYCDSINYLKTCEDVQHTFNNVYEHLKDNKYFIFDVHSTRKFEHYFNDELYMDELPDMLYTWEALKGEADWSVHHRLNFFVKESNDLYSRFTEEHFQQTYPVAAYIKMLENSGFSVEKIFADFDDTSMVDEALPANEVGDRIFFIAKK